MQRRTLLQAALAAIVLPMGVAHAAAPVVEVYKTPTCGCCHLWVDHLRANGFVVSTHDVPDTSIHRKKFGLPDEVGSCHTAMVGGYAIEGHVPAQDIKRLLAERPRARGLAAPGMPAGSPGMEGPRKDPFDVVLIQMDGRYKLYRHYAG
ncbi:MAG TPA: DUF411 domain-containing protein [Noviherbaspirillum sp.]|uniref:DUF411 domain-containing protein n=1 Tax=Noviherbaspirillum sp. TaxID=1926288 RepID=UPI002B4764C9|nr:DUF411 domain-containing protein [Noviherbaspirillum sp.]HJV87285.1 DUF411 domain-containing protein [Noviherbaspirillum sp.]